MSRTSWEVRQPTSPGLRRVLHARRVLPGGAEYVTTHELNGHEPPALLRLVIRALTQEIEDVVRACQ